MPFVENDMNTRVVKRQDNYKLNLGIVECK